MGETRTGQFQFSGSFNTDEGLLPRPAEVAPMPRAKGGFTFELDIRLSLGREVPAAPMPRAKEPNRVAAIGPLILAYDFDFPVNKGPFDRGQTFSISPGLFGGTGCETPPSPPLCRAVECCPVLPAAGPNLVKKKIGEYYGAPTGRVVVAATPAPVCPPCPTPVAVPPCPVTAAGLPVVVDPCGPIRFGFGQAERLGTDFPVPPMSASLPGAGPVLPRPAAPAVRTFEYHPAHPGRLAVAPQVLFQTPPLGGYVTSHEYVPIPPPPAVVRACTTPFTDEGDVRFPPPRQPAVSFPIPAGDAGFYNQFEYVLTDQKHAGVQACPAPAPVACPQCAGPAYPHPLRTVTAVPPRGTFVEMHYGSVHPCPPPVVLVPMPRVIVEVVGELRPASGGFRIGSDFHAGSQSFAVQLARPLPAPAMYPPFAGPGYPPPLATAAVPPCPPAPPVAWNPTPPPNVPAGEFGMMADALARMAGVAQAPAVRPAVGCAVPDPVLVPAPAAVGGCCVPVSAPRAAAAVEKPGLVGTWVREVGPVVYVLKVAPDHLTITVTAATEGDDKTVSTEGMVLTADYHLARDGATLVGLITGMDAALDGQLPDGFDLPRFGEEVARLQKALTDKPFALTARRYGDALVVGNVRLPEVADGPGTWCPLGMLGGRYAETTGKALPKPKAVKVAAPPALTLPMGRYLDRHYPQYFSPDPDFPLPRELATDRIPPPPPVATVTAPALPTPPMPTPTLPDAPAKGKKGKKKAETDDQKMKRLLYQSETLGPGPNTPQRITGGILP
ncbi:MAG: hypothetical protein C0501_09130 [Isosphaera sp.]|nr:hypothetical protein [Isosphaera sp.]